MKYFFMLFLVTKLLFAAPSDDFVITVKTDNPGVSANNEFTIPIANTNGAGYNVDCNSDGTDEVTGVTGNSSYTCVYGSAGTYTIRVKDNNGDKKGFRRIVFNGATDKEKLLEINQWGTAIWSSMVDAFRGTSNLTSTSAVDVPDLSKEGQTISLEKMFQDAVIADINTSGWNTSNVTNMRSLFRGATNANPDVSAWNTALVTRMDSMFQNATNANPDVSGWNTASVTRMTSMFRSTNANPNVVNWNTVNVTNTDNMFRDNTTANPDVSTWDTSSLTNINRMFQNASMFDRNMSGWDVSNITTATSFLRNVQLTQANYDALLSSWGNQAVQSGVTFHGGNSKYCAGEDGRNLLLGNSWSINDGGKDCGGVCASAVGDLTENHWTTISFPCATGSNGIEALIGAAIGGSYGNNNNWVVYQQGADYSGTSASMIVLDANSTVEPGKGYWIISDHNTTWHIDGALSGLDYSPTVTASSLGMPSDPDFDYVHKRDLPDTGAD